MSTQIRTRMAPSPTGEMHVGSMAILLKNYALAKKHGGHFILRIEDTDQVREISGSVDRLLQVIKDYGLDWDEGPDVNGPYKPYVQSQRLELYTEHAQKLLETNKAYYCFCTRDRLEKVRQTQQEAKQPPKYDRHCLNLSPEDVAQKISAGEPHVIRLRVPDNTNIEFTDLIRGKISIPSASVDDQVLMKSDGFPTYHLAVVVDDYLMKISHVLRGEEWISSTPKHVLLYEAFGWQQPIYAHIPIFLNPDGKGKMSKRKGTVSAQSFLDAGYLPEALLNFFMILGWAPEDQREIMTLDEYINEFDPKDISAKSVVFDVEKLKWLNGVYIRNLSDTELIERLKPYIAEDFPQVILPKVLDLIKERLVTLSEFSSLTDFFYQGITVSLDDLLKKSTTPELVREQLQLTQESLSSLTQWNEATIEQTVRSLQEKNEWKKGQYFMMLRIAATGSAATPPLFETIAVIGADQIKKRLTKALSIISGA